MLPRISTSSVPEPRAVGASRLRSASTISTLVNEEQLGGAAARVRVRYSSSGARFHSVNVNSPLVAESLSGLHEDARAGAASADGWCRRVLVDGAEDASVAAPSKLLAERRTHDVAQHMMDKMRRKQAIVAERLEKQREEKLHKQAEQAKLRADRTRKALEKKEEEARKQMEQLDVLLAQPPAHCQGLAAKEKAQRQIKARLPSWLPRTPPSTPPAWTRKSDRLQADKEAAVKEAVDAVTAEPEPRPETPPGSRPGLLEVLEQPPADHHYVKEPQASGKSSQKMAKRAAKEWRQLQSGLPSGVALLVSESRMDLLRAVFEGPADTPYEGGLFIIDICLPAEYPAVPPKCFYWSYGKYLNPNLYLNGKVCLSLLGTWHGPGWETERSTLLQLLVSVQGMILVDQPYCNEPGQEKDGGSQKATDYNKQVQADVLDMMTKMIRSPPAGLDNIVGQFAARAGAGLLRRAAVLPNDRISDAGVAALDDALGHPFGAPLTAQLRGSGLTKPAGDTEGKIPAEAQGVSRLLELGFNRASCEKALAESKGNLQAAAEQLAKEQVEQKNVEEFAVYIGMDPSDPVDAQLLWIAAEARNAALPNGWREYKDTDGNSYFHNSCEASNESTWEHPLDEHYRNLYRKHKQEILDRGAGDAGSDLKTDLKRVGGVQEAVPSWLTVAATPFVSGFAPDADDSSGQAGQSTVLEEEIDADYEPTEAEIVEYATWLGMDLEADKELFWIAEEGLKAPLPPDWKPCKSPAGEIYYFNFATGESQWDHPCDDHYKAKYTEEKKKLEQQKQQPAPAA